MGAAFDRTLSAFWDITLAILPVLIVQGWPEMFSPWLMLSGLPLLAMRYQLTRLAQDS